MLQKQTSSFINKLSFKAFFTHLFLSLFLILVYLIKQSYQGTYPLFATTLPDIQTSRWVLALTSPTPVNTFVTQQITLNYINAYTTGTPSVGLSFDYINANYQSTVIYNQTVLDISQITVTGSYVTIQVNRTQNFLISIAINYIVVKSGFFMDIKNQYVDLSNTNVYLLSVGTRTADMIISYRLKSNGTNTVLIYSTVGIFMAKNSNSFEYTLQDVTKSTSSYTLRISVMNNNKVKWIRISTVNYQSIATDIIPPYYLQMGFLTSLSGTVPDSSGIQVSSYGTIFSGLTDMLFSDSMNVLDYNMSSTGRILTLTTNSISRTKTSYFWYRQQTCQQTTYLLSHLCQPCHYSCKTCFDATNTSCLTCPTSRTYNTTDKTCPCNSGYADVGVSTCSQITCSYACLTCAGMNQCGTCSSSYSRILVGTSCLCMNYTFDNGVNAACYPCYYGCLSCTAMFVPTACTSCAATDHRIYRASNNTCQCSPGYYQIYANACPQCHYSCATCTNFSSCLTCNITLGRQYNSTSKLCNCVAGKYDDFLQQQCQPCPYYCLTCNSTACLSCPSGRTLNNNTGYCDCAIKYFDNSINIACQPCNYVCSQCVQATYCTNCNITMHRIMNSTSRLCICVDKYFDSSPNQECASCDKSCSTCNGPNTTNCLSCNSTAHRSLSLLNSCVCADKFYQYDSNTQLCSACNYTCQKCITTPDCTACDSTKFRQPSGNTCVCKAKYYDNGNQLCLSCYYRCLTCTNSSTCATCDSATRDTSNLALCQCKQGFYDDGISSSCLACQVQCLACVNGNNCSTCPTNKILTSTKDCICAPKTYQPNCLSCAYECQQCIGTANNCSLCNGAYYRFLNATDNSCACYQGYFDNGVDQLCSTCYYSCKTCTTFASCDTCPTNRQMNGSYCSCLPQYFQNSTNKNCIACHYSCQLCSSNTICSQCNGTLFRQIRSGSTLCQCMAGYYDDGSTQQCYKCRYDCKTCSAYATCLSCDTSANRYLLTSSCLCLDGFYQDTLFICQACHYSCQTCSKANQCLTCGVGRYLDSAGSKLCLCNSGTFDNPLTHACDNCGYPCQQCSQASTNCTLCDVTRLLTSNQCPCLITTFDNGTACQNCMTTCSSCTNASQCVACKAGINRNLNNGICQCIYGYYDNNGADLSCSKCHYSCLTCISSTICSTCATTRIPTGNLCACPANRYYDDGINGVCPLCHYTCLKCITMPNHCTSCLASQYRTLDTVANSCPCNVQYYDDGANSVCVRCQYTCKTCTSSTTCSLCDSVKKRVYATGPYCSCTVGYYDVGVQLCSQCDYKCKTCQISSTKCLTCPTTRTFNSGTNQCPCNSGLYDNGVATCASCLYSCLTCLTNIDCQTCDTTTRQLSASKQCICKDGYYNVNGVSTCATCSQTCLTCSAFSTCLSCNTVTTGRVLNSFDCLCQIGFYDDSANGVYVCQPCHYTCEYCTSSSLCTSCNGLAERVLNVVTKLCKCRDGFYDDGTNMGCLACSFDCVTCSNANTCLTCSTQRTLNGTTQRCDCSASYYQNGTSCQLCNPQCATCTNLNTCQTCNGIRILLNNACICPQGLYAQPASANCIDCQYSCQSCSSPSQCLTCNTTNHRYLSGVFCGCLNGYYDDGTNQLCATCHYTCKTCTVGNKCVTCDNSINRVYNIITQLCSCTSGYYEDPVSKNCIKCHYTCVTCTNGSACVTCNSNHLRSLSPIYQCTCPTYGYYDDGTNSQCAVCSPYCLSCTIASTNCTSCTTNSPTYRVLNVDSCLCKTGYYELNSMVNCQLCSYKCVTCSIDALNCTSCSPAANRQTLTSACACLQGFYDDGVNTVCKTCNFKCLTCTNGLSCSTCDSLTNKRQLSATTGYCECMINYYQTNVTACGQCYYTCASCNRGSLCLTCPTTRTYNTGFCQCNIKFYDDGSSLLCQPCHYSCHDCDNGTQCSVCSASNFRLYNSTSKYCDCFVTYYQQNSQELCLKCDISCATCTNGTHCQTCPTNINRTLNASSGSNYCVCLYSYYPDVYAIVNNYISCKPCHYSCESCLTQAYFCTSCDSNAHRTINTQQQCLCDITYYDDGVHQACLQCYAGCLTCWGTAINQCLSCSNTTYMLNNTCYTNCPNYYFNSINSNNQKVCSACPPYCLICTNGTFCDVCQTNFFILSVVVAQRRCYDKCPQYYYTNTTHCLQCVSPCLQCTDKYVCTTCIAKHYLRVQCQPCYSLCSTCNGGMANQCLSCADPLKYYLSSGVCLKTTCLSTQYVHATFGCQNCSDKFPHALGCSSSGVTICAQGYKLISGECFSCANVLGYKVANGVCQQICGDRLVFESKCDDGNTLNGDGCSSLCMVEQGWRCTNSSSCQLSITPTISAQSVTKVKSVNKIQVVLVLNIGLRLVKQNIILTFSGGQTYNHTLVALNTIMTRYKLQIEYYSSIANSNLNIKVRSPVPTTSRLLQNTETNLLQIYGFQKYQINKILNEESSQQSSKAFCCLDKNSKSQTIQNRQRILLQLSIQNEISIDVNLDLDLNLTIKTTPPATYISTQTRNSYSIGLMIFLVILRSIFLIVLIIVVILRLKVMLHMIDSIKMMSLLYLLGSLGMNSISSLTQSYIVVLRPFIYPFGQPFSQTLDISPADSGFTKLIISSFLIQFLIIIILSIWQIIKPSPNVNYFKTSFMFALVYDIVISCAIVFSWVGLQSYGDAFSWALGLVSLSLIISQSGFYYNIAQQYRKKGRAIIPGISNPTAQKQNSLNDQQKRVNQFIQVNQKDNYKDKSYDVYSDITQPLPINQKRHQTSYQNQNHYQKQNSYEIYQQLYDLAPSQILTPTYLPIHSCAIPCIFCIFFMIQTPIIRMSLITVLCIISFVYNVIKLPLKNARTVKVLIFQFICFLIAIIGLAGAILSTTSSTNLYFVQPTIATLIILGVVFNLITIIIAVYKSDSLSQFIVARKNHAVFHKNAQRISNKSPIKNIFHKKFQYDQGEAQISENNNQLDQTNVNKSIQKKPYYQKARDPRKINQLDTPFGDPSFISRDPFQKEVTTQNLNLQQMGIGYNVLKKEMDIQQSSQNKKRRMMQSDQQDALGIPTRKNLIPSQSQTSLISQKQLFGNRKKSLAKNKIKKAHDAMRQTNSNNMPIGIKSKKQQQNDWQYDQFGDRKQKLLRMDSISSIQDERNHFKKKQQDEGQALTVFKKILQDYQQSKVSNKKKGLIRKIKK